MPTTEDLITRLGAVLDHGPVSDSSLQYALATLDELSQRTRDLAGERDSNANAWQEMRDTILHGLEQLDNFQTNEVLAVIDQYDPTAALAPAEAGSGEAAKLSFVGVRATRSCDACGREHLPSPTPEPAEAGSGEPPSSGDLASAGKFPATPEVTARCAVCREMIGVSDVAAHQRCESPPTPEPDEARDTKCSKCGESMNDLRNVVHPPDRGAMHILCPVDYPDA